MDAKYMTYETNNPKDRKLIEVKDLSVSFAKTRGIIERESSIVNAVDRVSFEVKESEIFSLVGESGSGKTTIAKAILKLVTPTYGSIIYNGVDISLLKKEELRSYRKEVQMIFQDPFESLNPRQDIFTIVAAPARYLLGEKDPQRIKEIVIKVLNEVGLTEEILHRFPHQLSGGQRQRVNIARALVTNPRLLVADEPITMLDASQRLGILSLIMQLKNQRHMTVLMITHDLASAKMMSDKIAVLYRGKIMEIGSAEQVLALPLHPYTELILSSMPSLNSPLDLIKKDDYLKGEDYISNKGCRFCHKCRYSTSMCKEIEPSLVERFPSHFAACHFPLNCDNNSKALNQ